MPIEDLERILSEIDRFSTETTVILARIIKRRSTNTNVSHAQVEEYNEKLEEMAQRRIESGDKIILVDMENALAYPDDISTDTIHPEPSGYLKMAEVWFKALLSFSSFQNPLPMIVSSPDTDDISLGSVFKYDVNAYGGSGDLTYGFAETPPEGMSIDPETGLIEWIIQSPQDVEISVYAENSSGRDVQTFELKVVNQPPLAQSENSFMLVNEGDRVLLDGSSSYDPDGGIASWSWVQLTGEPLINLLGANTASAQFTAPAPESQGTFLFRLTITDRGGLTDETDVRISINSASPPVADAGGDQIVKSGDSVSLNGSASQGRISSYSWEQILEDETTPIVSLVNSGSPTSGFVAPLSAESDVILKFRLTVRDSTTGIEESDEVSITVLLESLPPVADAGDPQIVSEGASVTLDGSGSYDSDGGIAEYQWIQKDGTGVILATPNEVKTTFVAPAVNSDALRFELSVTDKDGLNSRSEVLISVNDNGIRDIPDEFTSITTATGRNIGVRVDSGGELTTLYPLSEGEISDLVDRPEDIMYGLIVSDIKTETVGGTATLTFYLPEAAPANYKWYEYHVSEGWQSLEAQTTFSPDRRQATLTLTDGGVGDSRQIVSGDGFIRSILALGVEPSLDKEEKNELISCFISSASGWEPDFYALRFIGFMAISLLACVYKGRRSKKTA